MTPPPILQDFSWDRMIAAVEAVKERMLRAAGALELAGIPYAVAGGNAVAAWEIYGPGEEDYRHLQPAGLKPRVTRKESSYEVTVNFSLARPGNYRLRTATVDLAGRTTVIWTPIVVVE